MARVETYATRSWAWSVMHRCLPKPAYMIDMDYLECCPHCKQPLIVGEIAKDVGQGFKATTILRNLARKAQLPAVLIFLREDVVIEAVESIHGSLPENGYPNLTELELQAIWEYLKDSPLFRLKELYPVQKSEVNYTVRQFFDWLGEIHDKHEASCQRRQ